MKSLRFMPHLRVISTMMARSWVRMDSSASRAFSTSESKCLGVSLIGANSSARRAMASSACLLARPFLSMAFSTASLASLISPKRRDTSAISMPLSSLSELESSSSSPSLSESESSDESESSLLLSSLTGAAVAEASSSVGSIKPLKMSPTRLGSSSASAKALRMLCTAPG